MKVNDQTVAEGTRTVFVYPNDTIEFHMYEGNTINLFGSFGVQDIAAKDDNYRQSCDDVLIVGETYLIGGAEVTCTGSDSCNSFMGYKYT
jgi:predicted GTPase